MTSSGRSPARLGPEPRGRGTADGWRKWSHCARTPPRRPSPSTRPRGKRIQRIPRPGCSTWSSARASPGSPNSDVNTSASTATIGTVGVTGSGATYTVSVADKRYGTVVPNITRRQDASDGGAGPQTAPRLDRQLRASVRHHQSRRFRERRPGTARPHQRPPRWSSTWTSPRTSPGSPPATWSPPPARPAWGRITIGNASDVGRQHLHHLDRRDQ